MPQIQPRSVTLSEVNDNQALPVRPNYAFLLKHHPSAWFVGEVRGEPTWLPLLKPMPLRPGSNWVKPGTGDSGVPQYRFAVSKWEDQGWTVLKDPGEYLVEVDARDPATKRKGKFYFLRWEVPTVNPMDGVVRLEDEAGRKDYHAWLASLVERGTIAPPSEIVLQALRERVKGHLSRQSANAHLPGVAAQMEREKDRLEEREAAHFPSSDHSDRADRRAPTPRPAAVPHE